MMYGARVRDVIGRRIVGAPAVVVVPEAAAAGAPAAVLEGHDNDDFSVGWADDLVPDVDDPQELVDQVPFAAVAAAAAAGGGMIAHAAGAAVPVAYSDEQELHLGGIRRTQLVAACWAAHLDAM